MSGLRPYQIQLTRDCYAAWDAGAANVCAVMPTGSGKTRTVAHMIAEMNEPTAVVAHRQELVGQLSVALARERIRHGILAPASVVRDIVQLQIEETGSSYFDPNARTKVAGVNTLARMGESDPWWGQVRRWVNDEFHHVQAENLWGRTLSRFKHARGLGPTATPCRADKKGVGRGHGGIADAMVMGPEMHEIRDLGFLTPYDVACPPSDVDYSDVGVGASGDLSINGLRKAVHRSTRIVGDVVGAYLEHAEGKRGITFAVDVEAAEELAEAYRKRGVPAAVIHGSMGDRDRIKLMRLFRSGALLQLCNCDILGEGVDVPAVEVVSMARKTLSLPLYMQQGGRMMRPFEGKTRGLLIDHVGNFNHHKPFHMVRAWTLEGTARPRRKSDAIPMRACALCTMPYEVFWPSCPHCGFEPVPASRSKPSEVDGDITLLDPEVIEAMCKAVDRAPVFRIPFGADARIVGKLQKDHTAALERFEAQKLAQGPLREAMAQWGGYATRDGLSVRAMQRKFHAVFDVDVISAQALGAVEASNLEQRIRAEMM